MRGRGSGDAVDGTAILQDAAGTAATHAAIKRRYGIQARLAYWREDRKAKGNGASAHQGIAIRLDGDGTKAG
jgi:hypothetical protein